MRRPKLTTPVLKVMVNIMRNQQGLHCGADITRETAVSAGTLYPLLRRLETAGWLISKDEEIDPVKAGRPAKKFYRLTVAGQKVLAAKMNAVGRELMLPPAIVLKRTVS